MNNKLVPLNSVPTMIANNNNMQTMLAQPSHNNQMFSNNNNNNVFSNRMGVMSQPSGRRMQPKGIVRGRRRFPGEGRGMRNMRGQRPEKMRGQRNNFRRYVEYHPRVPAREPGNRRFDMPNIYSQVTFLVL